MLVNYNPKPLSPKRVVVIGASGHVGSAIINELARVGIEILGLTRNEVDLIKPDSAAELQRVIRSSDSVVFVSAIAPAKSSRQLMDNLTIAENALQAFNKVPPAHFLYISSDAVYADDANPVSETSPIAPSTIHGMMHAARELIFRTELQSPFVSLRPTLIYGARDPHSGYGPNRFRRQARNGEPITLFGEGEEKRDHIAVEDVARLAVRILQYRSTGALNAVTGVSIPFYEIAALVANQFQTRVELKNVPRVGPRPHLLHRFFDITNCLRAFPDFHFEPLAEGIARVHRELSG